MAAKKTPTLADIWLKLGGQDEILNQIHTQVKSTNGRVTKLEKWKDSIELGEKAVEEYKAKHPRLQTQQEKAEGWTVREKTLTAIITALLAIITALVSTGQL